MGREGLHPWSPSWNGPSSKCADTSAVGHTGEHGKDYEETTDEVSDRDERVGGIHIR